MCGSAENERSYLTLNKGANAALGVAYYFDIFDLHVFGKMFGEQSGKLLLIDGGRKAKRIL